MAGNRLDDLIQRVDRVRDGVVRRLRRLSALWPLVAIVLSAILAGLVYAAEQWTDFDSTSLSIIFGFGAGFAVFMQRAAADKRQYTVELLSAFSTNEVLAPADHWMAEKIAAGAVVDAGSLEASELSHLVALLDYYEFLCILVKDELIERRVFLDLRQNALCAVRSYCAAYIEERRIATGFSGLYKNIVDVCDTYAPDRPTIGSRTP